MTESMFYDYDDEINLDHLIGRRTVIVMYINGRGMAICAPFIPKKIEVDQWTGLATVMTDEGEEFTAVCSDLHFARDNTNDV